MLIPTTASGVDTMRPVTVTPRDVIKVWLNAARKASSALAKVATEIDLSMTTSSGRTISYSIWRSTGASRLPPVDASARLRAVKVTSCASAPSTPSAMLLASSFSSATFSPRAVGRRSPDEHEMLILPLKVTIECSVVVVLVVEPSVDVVVSVWVVTVEVVVSVVVLVVMVVVVLVSVVVVWVEVIVLVLVVVVVCVVLVAVMVVVLVVDVVYVVVEVVEVVAVEEDVVVVVVLVVVLLTLVVVVVVTVAVVVEVVVVVKVVVETVVVDVVVVVTLIVEVDDVVDVNVVVDVVEVEVVDVVEVAEVVDVVVVVVVEVRHRPAKAEADNFARPPGKAETVTGQLPSVSRVPSRSALLTKNVGSSLSNQYNLSVSASTKMSIGLMLSTNVSTVLPAAVPSRLRAGASVSAK
mmetsp:Transcript_32092/g.68706  ORF Transcript_32092/g.68706 Transcript_32092/m.68706 type:complete len:409 (-) Transcript_32092:8-1234(-)